MSYNNILKLNFSKFLTITGDNLGLLSYNKKAPIYCHSKKVRTYYKDVCFNNINKKEVLK